jgi:Sec-independent protein translocase protein TatA
MPWRRFFAYDVAGALIWGIGHTTLGYLIGASYERWEGYLTPVGLGIAVVLLLLIGAAKLRAARRSVAGDLEEIGEGMEQEAEARAAHVPVASFEAPELDEQPEADEATGRPDAAGPGAG